MISSRNWANYEKMAAKAVQQFWRTRQNAGNGRTAVVGGKNMDGFIRLIEAVAEANGLPASGVFSKDRTAPAIPGYFRAAKNWDVLILDKNVLVGVVEFKSHVGSFGNNFNNRCEEALGNAIDLRTALEKNVFESKPFPGYLMLVEDSPKSRRKIKINSPHFNVDKIFENTSYLERYGVFCERLVQKGLYDSAALLTSPREGGLERGAYSGASPPTSLKAFVSALAEAMAAHSNP